MEKQVRSVYENLKNKNLPYCVYFIDGTWCDCTEHAADTFKKDAIYEPKAKRKDQENA